MDDKKDHGLSPSTLRPFARQAWEPHPRRRLEKQSQGSVLHQLSWRPWSLSPLHHLGAAIAPFMTCLFIHGPQVIKMEKEGRKELASTPHRNTLRYHCPCECCVSLSRKSLRQFLPQFSWDFSLKSLCRCLMHSFVESKLTIIVQASHLGGVSVPPQRTLNKSHYFPSGNVVNTLFFWISVPAPFHSPHSCSFFPLRLIGLLLPGLIFCFLDLFFSCQQLRLTIDSAASILPHPLAKCVGSSGAKSSEINMAIKEWQACALSTRTLTGTLTDSGLPPDLRLYWFTVVHLDLTLSFGRNQGPAPGLNN